MREILPSHGLSQVLSKIYRKYDHIITYPHPATEITRMLPGKEVTMIPNGVNRENFRKDPRNGNCSAKPIHSDDSRVVLSVAQQTPLERVFMISCPLTQIPDMTFVG